MEIWLVLAVSSIFFAGLKNFGLKVIAQRKYNTSLVSIYSYISASIFSGWYYFYLNGLSLKEEFLYILIGLALLKVVLWFLNTITKVISLENIQSVIFFPLFKTTSLVSLTLSSIFIFWESMDKSEAVWVAIWFTIPFLLFSKWEVKRHLNFKKGVLFLILTSFLMVLTSIVEKEINMRNWNIELFVFLSMTFGIFVSSFSYKVFHKEIKWKIKYHKKWVELFWIWLWILHFLTAYTFIKALQGNLAIVFTINSFSILIPIILSVIFYKEEMTYKKAFVIFLSIVSVILFI